MIFGVQMQQETLSYEEIRNYVLDLESWGFYSALTVDHLHPIFYPETVPIMENWVLISALAKETNKIRLGTLVNCNSYRYPSLLAKMAATFDVISNGRLEFMFGAGWNKQEYLGYGIPFPPARIRIEQMKEAVQIIKKMWTEPKVYFKGKYYEVDGAVNYPKPIQKPYPRIWIGGTGDLLVKSAAEVGEGVNFWGLTPEIYKKKLDLLKQSCVKAKRDYDGVEKSYSADLIIGRNQEEINRRLRKLEIRMNNRETNEGREKRTWKREDFEGHVMGTPSEIVERIEQYRKIGVDYVTVTPSDFRDLSDIRLFKDKVVSAYR